MRQGEEDGPDFVHSGLALLHRAESAGGEMQEVWQDFVDCMPGMRVGRCPTHVKTWVHRKIAKKFRTNVAGRSKNADADFSAAFITDHGEPWKGWVETSP